MRFQLSTRTIHTRVPLAARLRPQSIEDYIGQEHVLGAGGVVRTMLDAGNLDSMIMTGPPGVGKTTLAQLLAQTQNAHFEILSAVNAGVKDIRQVLEAARTREQATVVFVDEIHRFNKSQQDAFLPAIEEGIVTFLGATTENPGFYVNNALQSRVHLVFLQLLTIDNLKVLLERALRDDEFVASRQLNIPAESAEYLCEAANGDARRLLNMVEALAKSAKPQEEITVAVLKKRISHLIRFDQKGDEYYECISAFHKSLRGSDPDAALYWMVRMLESGCDPASIFRRMFCVASEDVGNADPQALPLAVAGSHAIHMIGMPEAAIILSQVTTYLASAPKSNASYMAVKKAQDHVRKDGTPGVPLHLRNAPTQLMKEENYGKDYDYPHNHPEHFTIAKYFPKGMQKTFYQPTNLGYENFIRERLVKYWPDRYKE